MKAFLRDLNGENLRGCAGFAFDTRFAAPLSGHASSAIEKQLKNCGLEIITRHFSAFVEGGHKEVEGGVRLREGEQAKFEEIGKTIGKVLSAKIPKEEGVVI